MTVAFVRHPKNPGINKTAEPEPIFQHTLGHLDESCYLTVDIDKDGNVMNELYTRPYYHKFDDEKMNWDGI